MKIRYGEKENESEEKRWPTGWWTESGGPGIRRPASQTEAMSGGSALVLNRTVKSMSGATATLQSLYQL